MDVDVDLDANVGNQFLPDTSAMNLPRRRCLICSERLPSAAPLQASYWMLNLKLNIGNSTDPISNQA